MPFTTPVAPKEYFYNLPPPKPCLNVNVLDPVRGVSSDFCARACSFSLPLALPRDNSGQRAAAFPLFSVQAPTLPTLTARAIAGARLATAEWTTLARASWVRGCRP